IDLSDERAEFDVGRRLIESGIDGLQNLVQPLFSLSFAGRLHRSQRHFLLYAPEVPVLGDPISIHVAYSWFPIPPSAHFVLSCASDGVNCWRWGQNSISEFISFVSALPAIQHASTNQFPPAHDYRG